MRFNDASGRATKTRPRHERSRRAAGMAVALAAGGAITLPLMLAPGSPAASLSPAQLAQSALRNGVAQSSVHESESAKSARLTTTSTADVEAKAGLEDIRIADAGEARVAVLPGIAYFTANQQVLVTYFGFPSNMAAAIQGHWIGVPASSSAYAPIASGATISSSLNQLTPQGPLAETAPTSVNGQPVTGIRGTIKSSNSTPATATLYVSRAANPLPVRVDYRDSKGDTATISFSRWGERLSVTAPASVIPISTLQQTSADASAEEIAHTAQVAAESYATDHAGSYAGLTPAVLHRFESTVPITPGTASGYVSGVSASRTSYTITVTAVGGGETFSISRSSKGTITRTCTPASGVHHGCINGAW